LNVRSLPAAVLCAVIMTSCASGTALETTPASLPTAFVARPPTSPARVNPAPWHAPNSSADRVTTAGARAAVPTSAATPPTPPAEIPTLAATAEPSTDPALLEALLVAEINRIRDANALPPYHHSPELSAAARAHSCDLAAHGTISHTSTDGRTLADRLAGSTPPWEWPSESIAAGFGEPAAIVALWMDEPPDGWHRRNILDPDQHEVGAGYCFAAEDPSGNHHYWTADFSRRASSP
jgi:uncharacterized protein YkwD